MSKKENKKTVCIRFDLDKTLNNKIQFKASEAGVTKPEYIRAMLKAALITIETDEIGKIELKPSEINKNSVL